MTQPNDRDNHGPSVSGLVMHDDTVGAEMTAFDQLGPKTRAVINFEFGVKWSSSETLKHVRERMRVNPLDPRTDARIAEWLRQANIEILSRLKAG